MWGPADLSRLAAAFAAGVAFAGAAVGAVPVRSIVEIENVSQPFRFIVNEQNPTRRPNYTPTVFPLLVVFHDGTVDLFNTGDRARPELGWLASEGIIAPFVEALRREHPDAVINMITNNYFGSDEPFFAETWTAREQSLLPSKHRYFSYVGKVGPSDDAFIGNDDPRMYEVFDESGLYKGPVVISVRGSQVLDAGVKLNDEQNMMYFHNRQPDVDAGVGEASAIAQHPGFNGSMRNPEGHPIGVLGVPSDDCQSEPEILYCFLLDPIEGDFTRPEHVLAVVRVTAGLDGSYSGFWYDPARSGEGFNVSIVEGDPPKMAVAWYTYDSQHNPLYLTGAGDVQHQFAEIDVVSTSGGGLASTENPQDVTRSAWGTIRLGFGECDSGRVFYEPLSDVYTSGNYFITRATPRGVGTHRDCGEQSLELHGAPDDEWPTALDHVAPDPGVSPG